jgi:hypothetical protein
MAPACKPPIGERTVATSLATELRQVGFPLKFLNPLNPLKILTPRSPIGKCLTSGRHYTHKFFLTLHSQFSTLKALNSQLRKPSTLK